MFGPPGSGKGTVAKRLLRTRSSTAYLATGDHFRQLILANDRRAEMYAECLTGGLLVPDDIVIAELRTLWLSGRFNSGFVLDGFPRTIVQVQLFEAMLAEFDSLPVQLVAYLDVPIATLIARLSGRRICGSCSEIYHIELNVPKVAGRCNLCGERLIIRDDDEPKAVKRRLEIYRTQTTAVLAHYESEGLLLHLDGSLEAGTLADEIAAVLRRGQVPKERSAHGSP